MSDIAEGIGGAIEGALAGRAIEPKSGEPDGDIATYSAEACANCGTVHSHLYCPQCGQKRHVHRTLSAIFHDLIHGVLHLDGKFWLTLPLLVFKPGKLTRRYIEGERAKFVSPMAMFLFSVFAMFAIFQMIGLSTPTTLEAPGTEQVEATVNAGLDRLRNDIAEVDEQLENSELSDGERRELEARRDLLESDLSELLVMGELPFVEIGPPEAAIAADGAQEVNLTEDGSARMTYSGTGIEWLDEGLIKKWQENPGLMLYKLQANAYKFSWLLIPLSLPFVWLLFAWRRGFKAYDHAIFVTYSLSFMSLLFITMSLIGVSPLGVGWAFTIFATVAPLHVYKHLRYAYGLSRFSALWRFFALLFFIVIVLTLFLQALILLGAF